jgi:hypothetical protein
MAEVLTHVNKGQTEQKIKPVVNVRQYPGSQTFNNTAFYFKTEKNYHFVTVNETTLRLEVKTIPKSQKTQDTYTKYLTFGAKIQPQCPVNQLEETDGPRPVKTAISTSPTSDLGTEKTDSEWLKKSSTYSSSSSSTPSDAPSPGTGDKFKFEGMASDSGVDDGMKDLEEEPVTGPPRLGAN